jgi:acyl carrier protein
MTRTTIREILRNEGDLSVPIGKLSDDDDLHEAGLSSFGTVKLMLALEGAFEVEFDPTFLSRSTFSSIASIAAAVEALQSQRSAAA